MKNESSRKSKFCEKNWMNKLVDCLQFSSNKTPYFLYRIQFWRVFPDHRNYELSEIKGLDQLRIDAFKKIEPG